MGGMEACKQWGWCDVKEGEYGTPGEGRTLVSGSGGRHSIH